jgi:hypothetical protein
MVGGHVGAAVPVVSLHSVGKTTMTPSDQLTSRRSHRRQRARRARLGRRLRGRRRQRREAVGRNRPHDRSGVVYVGAPVALGLRAKFDVNAPANFGLIPLSTRASSISARELVRRGRRSRSPPMRGAGYALAAVAHTGFAF